MTGSLTLRDHPSDLVRLACEKCGRAGQYPKRTLIERFGADICLPDLREETAQCERARQMHEMHDMCGVRYLGLTAKPAATIAGTMGSTVNVSNDRKELASRVLADWATPESKH